MDEEFRFIDGDDTFPSVVFENHIAPATSLEHNKNQQEEYDIITPYLEMVKSKIKLNKKLKVVLDGGNGTSGLIAPKLLRDLGCEVTELYCNLDGNFPNHFPDPTVVKNLTDLIKKVKDEKADVGIGYDGDADRYYLGRPVDDYICERYFKEKERGKGCI